MAKIGIIFESAKEIWKKIRGKGEISGRKGKIPPNFDVSPSSHCGKSFDKGVPQWLPRNPLNFRKFSGRYKKRQTPPTDKQSVYSEKGDCQIPFFSSSC